MTTALLRIGLQFCNDLEELAAAGDAPRRDRLLSDAGSLRALVARHFSEESRGIDDAHSLEDCARRALEELRRDVAPDEIGAALERGELFLRLFRRSVLPLRSARTETAS
jgi:hypothetical protein